MSDSFEQLLARTEHAGGAPAGSCPDAEVLAAYLDATLTPPERAGVEAHAADCARCALQLATVVRLEDVSGNPQHAPAHRWWPRVAWMVPAAVAVVVASVYVVLPSGSVPQQPPAEVSARQDRAERKELEASHPQARRELLEESQYAVVPPAGNAPGATSIASAARAPAPQLVAPPRASERAATQEPSAAGAAAGDAALTRGELQRKAEGQPAAPPEADLRLNASSPRRGAMVGQAEAVEKRADLQPRLMVRSPDARVQWRIVGDRIERSTDAGRTWDVEPAPALEAVIMGAAPSVDVCWVAGGSGQVLRRTEDGHWADVSPAPRLAIVRLDVSTSLAAVAVGADGTTAKTADGGQTWMR
jgi:hypothetical protein